MAATFQLKVATPERIVLDLQVEFAEIPAENGYIGILPEHAPLLAELGSGELRYTIDGEKKSIHVEGGLVEVQPRVTSVLAGSAK